MWPNPQFPADFFKFTEEILNRKPHFCAVDVRNESLTKVRSEHSHMSTDAENRSLFLQKALSWVFDRILNTFLAPLVKHFFLIALTTKNLS